MVRALTGFKINPFFRPTRLTLISTSCHSRLTSNPLSYLLSTSFSNASNLSLSPHHHYPFDKTPQRTTTFVFRALGLLKHTLLESILIASFHCLSLKTSVISDLAARTSLLTAYARAYDLDSSLALFRETVDRDVVFWNAIINAFALNCHFRSSISLFQEMVKEFVEFDSTTLVSVLSALSHTDNLKHGEILHGTITKRCFDSCTNLCNALIDMYAKCGDLNSSELVFEWMDKKDTTSWNSMINGTLYNGYPERSAFYFKEMSRSTVRTDEVSLSGVISSCSFLDELSGFGESVHGWVIKLGYGETHHPSVSNSLISFYSQRGDIEASELVFTRLVQKSVATWNSMIKGLVENKRVNKAIDCFRAMQLTPTTQPDAITVITVIPVCGEHNLLLQGKSIHGLALRRELERSNPSVGNSLLDMYLKCEDIRSANLVFRMMPKRDLISWNTMISGCSRIDSLKKEAQALFRNLLQVGLRCSLATLLAILPSCTCHEDLHFGKVVHSWKIKYGFATNVSAVNALMLMYINCGDLNTSTLLLQTILCASDVVSWNTIIAGFVQNGYYKDALEAFDFMRYSLHLNPDPITMVSVLSACGNLGLLLQGRFMHGLALKSMMCVELQVKNALLTMYCRCGDTDSAEVLFHMDGNRNLCSWICMVSGFAQNKKGRRALEFFRHIKDPVPNEISIVGSLCACAQLGDIRHGNEIHGYVFRFHLQSNIFIASALVDMYSKCGRLGTAVLVFESSKEKSVASWNCMISAYGFHGKGRKAIDLFSKMCDSGVKATKSTFISLLSACNHSGLVDEGWKHYNLMSEMFGIQPTVEHHVCMVDMLGRAGRLGEAFDFVANLPMKAEPGVWGALLSACKDHANFKMAESIAEHLFFLDSENAGYYVTLFNLYAYNGMWSDAVNIRSMIQDRGLMKSPGCSVIDAQLR